MRYALDNEKLTVQEFLSMKYICSSFKICDPRSLFLYEKNVAWKQCDKDLIISYQNPIRAISISTNIFSRVHDFKNAGLIVILSRLG